MMMAVFGLQLFLFNPIFTSAEEPTLQHLIDEAEPGETVVLEAGNYEESIIINKPLHLKGNENVTLKQTGSNPLITIETDHAMIENLNLSYSSSDSDSPAILLTGDDNLLSNVKMETDSFGVQLDDANGNTLSDLTILGNEDEEIKQRQHGIDLWQSHDNVISDARIEHVKDGIYIEKSNENKIQRNTISHSRYGTHLMYANDIELVENESFANVSGLYVMATEGTIAKHNVLRDNQKNVQSMGLFLFDSTKAKIKENTIENNRIGMFIESAHDNELALNHVQGNYTGMQFKEAENNNMTQNAFIANVVQGQATESPDNFTNQNYWGDHLGLDITGDNQSDLTYQVDPFFLNITNEFPPFQLLFQSPGMMFLEQLISTPVDQQLVDESPLLENPLVVSDEQSVSKGTYFLVCLSLLILSLLIIYLGVRKNEKA